MINRKKIAKSENTIRPSLEIPFEAYFKRSLSEFHVDATFFPVTFPVNNIGAPAKYY